MKLLTNFKSIEEDFGLIIGNFDGVHLGHRNLLEDFVNNCRSKSLAPVLLTFNPHPRFYFVPDTTDFKINDSARKSDLLAQCNLKYLIELPFDQSIQQLEAREFLENFIFCYPNLKLMAIGHDFAMGAGKEDSRKLVKQLCELKNVTLTEAKSHSFKNEIVSSSMIRKLIKQGQVKEANEFLARDFSLTGTVVKGQGIGSKKLVPTINTEFDYSQLLPKNGVYITRVKVNGKYFNSTTNIGVRPTVSKDDIRKLETFIFDFNEDIYGAEVSIIFLERLREEVKFDSLEDLKKQIDADVERAKKYFKTDTTPHLALVGRNIKHSKSQSMYEKLLDRSISYDLLDYDDEKEIPKGFDLLNKYSGVSITAPYKKHFTSEFSVDGDYFDVVNCLKKSSATNTDFLAANEILHNILDEFNPSEIVILGDGDMSKMLQTILNNIKRSHQVLSRKKSNLDTLAQFLEATNGQTLVINSCLREYKPSISSNSRIYFWDLNYNVDYESQLRQNKNLLFEDGLYLLELQAKYALNFWNLKTP